MYTNRFNAQHGSAKIGCIVAVAAVVLVVLIMGLMFMGRYNSLVGLEEAVQARWSEIDNQYKRRFDLVPQLVSTVQGAADFEKTTLDEVTEARASVGRMQLPPGIPTDPAMLQSYMQAQQGLGAALGRLFAVSEAYPQLKATQNFLSLQDQLEGTENRIAVARRDYIDSVRAYNTTRRRFPTNFIAGMFGFDEIPQLAIEEGERATPDVQFNFDKEGS